MLNRLFSLLILLLMLLPARGVERQVRAAYISIDGGVDWPRGASGDHAREEALRQTLMRLRQLNFNTVYVQVSAEGTALWDSGFLPRSQYATTNGILDFLLDECRYQALECHAVVDVLDMGTPLAAARYYGSAPAHPIHDMPGFCVNAGGRVYLDPGNPGVESLTTGVVRELLNRYDFDGLMLRGLNYPPLQDFDDYATYAIFNPGYLPRTEWQSANIDRLARIIADEARSARPGVKVGLMTMAVYRNAAGYGQPAALRDGRQDAAALMRDGVIDCVAPAMTIADAEEYASALATWQSVSNGRRVTPILSLASLTDPSADWPASVLEQQIAVATDGSLTDGVAFDSSSRLVHSTNAKNSEIANALTSHYFAGDALVPVMSYSVATPYSIPPLSVSQVYGEQDALVSWEEPDSPESPRYYNVYRADDRGRVNTSDPGALVATRVTNLELGIPTAEKALYAVTAFNRDHIESEPVSATSFTGVDVTEQMCAQIDFYVSGGCVDIISAYPIDRVEVYTLTGVKVETNPVRATQATVDLRRHSRGIYLIRVADTTGHATVRKFAN